MASVDRVSLDKGGKCSSPVSYKTCICSYKMSTSNNISLACTSAHLHSLHGYIWGIMLLLYGYLYGYVYRSGGAICTSVMYVVKQDGALPVWLPAPVIREGVNVAIRCLFTHHSQIKSNDTTDISMR